MPTNSNDSTPQHTPGPWELDEAEDNDGTLWVLDSGPECPCIVAIIPNNVIGGVSHQQANAHLIAAAPETAAERDRLKEINAELVAALNACEKAMAGARKELHALGQQHADAWHPSEVESVESVEDGLCEASKVARKAISKAEGRP